MEKIRGDNLISDHLQVARDKLLIEMRELRRKEDEVYTKTLKERLEHNLKTDSMEREHGNLSQPEAMGELSIAIGYLAEGMHYANELIDNLKSRVNSIGEYAESKDNQQIGVKNLQSVGVTKLEHIRSIHSDLDVLINKIKNINSHLQQVL